MTSSASSPPADAAVEAMDGGMSDIMDQLWLRVFFLFLYGFIFLVGNSGNCLVVFVVLRNKQMQTITNIFITNLALSDILMCSLAVPFTPLSFFMKRWVFGDILCHILPMTLGVSVYVSTLTSTAIAVDRYFVIVHPFKPRMKTSVCLLLILAIWVISISISLPLGIYAKVLEQDGEPVCMEHWPHTTSRQFFTATSLILQYIVPCAIISYCYSTVWGVLSTRTKSRMGTRSQSRNEIELKRKKKTNTMLVAMISIFVVCWLPLNAVLIILDYEKSFHSWSYHYLIFFIAHVTAMSSTLYNPFLYAWMNENFNKEFKTVLPACLFRGRAQCYNGGVDTTTQYTTVDTANNHDSGKLRVDGVKADHVTELVKVDDCAKNGSKESEANDVKVKPNSNGDAIEQIELEHIVNNAADVTPITS